VLIEAGGFYSRKYGNCTIIVATLARIAAKLHAIIAYVTTV